MFTPIKSQVGMEMSVTKIDIPYSKIVEILGPPQKGNAGNQRSKALGYATEAEWMFEFFDIPFKIRYDSSDWVMRYLERQKTVKSQKIPPLEKIDWGEIIGRREFVEDIVKKILIVQADMPIPSFHKKQLVIDIFSKADSYKR